MPEWITPQIILQAILVIFIIWKGLSLATKSDISTINTRIDGVEKTINTRIKRRRENNQYKNRRGRKYTKYKNR